MEGPKNALEQFIPSDLYLVVPALCQHPLYVYQHIRTGLPMACVAGGHAGNIIGGIVWFRDATDSMNMEMEVPMEMMQFEFKFVDQMIGKPDDATVDGIWSRFMNNLTRRLSQKRGFTKDGTPVPLVQEKEEEKGEEAQESPQKRSHNDEEANTCMICYENPPDTTVTPCMHCVVCANCSVGLEKTPDAKVCCQCRCPITGIYYPDNTMKTK